MEPFKHLSGIAAPLPEANIDTDVIMPKQFLKGIDRSGLERGLFFDRRFLSDGRPNPGFILNQPGYRGASFLVVGPNFGCGSSREHAVWGLKQFGIRVLIGTTFAGIFDDNCRQNGLVTISLDEEQYRVLLEKITCPQTNRISVSLDDCTLRGEGLTLPFALGALKRDMLMAGGDAIAWTLRYADDIRRFETDHFTRFPWLRRPDAQS